MKWMSLLSCVSQFCYPRLNELESSVAQLCPTLCDPMDCSMPGFPVLHHLPEFAQTHVHWVGDADSTISSSVVPFSSCLQSCPASGSFPISQFFTPGGQNIGASASASVLPMNIQDLFPLGLTGWIFLQSKGWVKGFLQHHSSKASVFISVSLLLSRILGHCYHLSKFHIYALKHCIGVFSFWLTSLCIIGSSFIHLIRTHSNVFFLIAE